MPTTTLPTTTAERARGSGVTPAARTAPRASLTTLPAPVEVRRLHARDDAAAWNALLATRPESTVFHTPAWSDAVATAFGHRSLHLGALRDGTLVGVLPLMEVRSLLAGCLHISVPYATYGGVVAVDAEARRALALAAAASAVTAGAQMLELRSAESDISDFELFPGYVGFLRTLPDDPADVPAFIPKRPRAAARHARERDGVTITHIPEHARLVWELYTRSMRRLASLSYPWRFFAALRTRLAESCWVSVAWRGRRPLCGAISLVHGDTVTPYIMGADERVRADGAANLLYLSLMERAVRAGLRGFDFGRSRADNAGAVGFKKNQGFEPQPLGYQRYITPGHTAPDLKPTNPRYALARRFWPHLPLPVCRLLSGWVARAIPG
ncbi:MAG: GNAT family N-acetyltransferase [Phycisphaerales bacterium]|nr:GNAT family N-acetyltransferase [Phycisphaerales bacterium]